MSNSANFAFNFLNNDELFDTIQSSESDQANQNFSSYEDYISNTFNTSAQEFEYSLDSSDPVQSPSCVYLTETQYKHHNTNTADDTLLLAHFNIRSINKTSITCAYYYRILTKKFALS